MVFWSRRQVWSSFQKPTIAESLPHDLVPQGDNLIMESMHKGSLHLHPFFFSLAACLEVFDKSLLSIPAFCGGFPIELQFSGMLLGTRSDAAGGGFPGSRWSVARPV
jgi:hypothetical protein